MDKIKKAFTSMSTGLKSVDWRSSPLALVWLASGVTAIIIPLSVWGANKASYYSSYGYYVEYEEQQRQYEEQQNGNNNNDNNNNYYYKECQWWNLQCKTQQAQYAQNQDDGNGNGQTSLPAWYYALGGQTEEMRRWQEENNGRQGGTTGPTAGEKFVYVWLVLMFIGILIYGAIVLFKRQTRSGLFAAMFLFANFCLMAIVMAANGVISSENREFEESVYGWYGQIGVLIAYQSFWCLLFNIAFGVVFSVLSSFERVTVGGVGSAAASADVEMSSAAGYNNMDESAPTNSGVSA